jgi:hypothetical protein
MNDLELIIAKYYFPDELFVGQVQEIIKLLTAKLADQLPHPLAIRKANEILTKHYFNGAA